MNKKLSKEIMKRSRLKNEFLKTKTDTTEKLTINKEIIVYLFFAEKRNPFPITQIQKRLLITNVSGKLLTLYGPGGGADLALPVRFFSVAPEVVMEGL